MTTLRQRMLEDMQVRNLSPHTQRSYVQQVSQFARYFQKSPAVLGPEDIRSYQLYLTNDRKLAVGSVLIAVAALRFLYTITLKKDWPIAAIPAPKKPQRLPIVLSPDEVLQFLECVAGLKHRAILTTCYAAGLRISEVLHLRPTDIVSRRMVIRVDQGKGQKDRYVMLSPRLMELLRTWWRAARPTPWLFPGDRPGQPISKDAVEQACQKARRRCRIPKPITPHALKPAPTSAPFNSCSAIAVSPTIPTRRASTTRPAAMRRSIPTRRATNTATGVQALLSNTIGVDNTASGLQALYNDTTGNFNAAFGSDAGFYATTGSYNLFLGAEVTADTNTIRIGLPYDGTNRQNRTFIAGIYGATVTTGQIVVIDANGQLGTFSAPTALSASGTATLVPELQQQVRDQQTTIADLSARLARLEALIGQSARAASKP